MEARTAQIGPDPPDAAPEWEAIARVAAALVQEPNLGRVGAVAVDEAARLLGARAAGVWILEPAGTALRLLAQHGFGAATVAEIGRIPLSAPSVAALAARTGEPVEVADVEAAGPELDLARRVGARDAVRSMLAHPLVVGGAVVGALSVVPPSSDRPHVFTERERRLVRAFADLCAAAVQNARRAEELRRSEERHRLAVRASTDVVWDWERATGEVVWNEELRRAFGWAPDAPGRSLDESIAWLLARVHPEDRARVRATLGAASAGELASWREEYRFRRADGSYGVVLDRGHVLRDEDGLPTRIVAAIRDVTLRKHAEEAQRFFAEASRALASSLDLDTILRRTARLAIPALADWCAVDLLEGETARAVAGAHADPARQPLLHELQRRYPPTTRDDRPVARVLRSGRPVLLPEMNDAELDETSTDAEHAALRRAVGFASLLIVPLLVGGRTLGAITFARGPDRPRYGSEELPVAEELGRRAAVAVDNARLYREAQEQATAHAELSRALRETADALRESEERFRRLVAALLAVGASGGQDVDAVLDTVAAQTRALFGAEHAGVQLAVPGTDEFVRRRGSPLAQPEAEVLQAGARFRPDPLAREAIETGRALFATDFHRDERVAAEVRAALPGVASSMVVPMAVDGETIGFLFALWPERYDERPGDAETALLLARHAAAVVRTARALDEARRAQAEAERAVHERDAFLGVAAHELKTPVTSLRGFAQVLLRQLGRGAAPDPERVARAMEQVDRQSRRLAVLIEQLLDVARLEAGHLRLAPEHVDLAALVRDAAEGLQTTHPGHPIRVSAPVAVPAWADPLRIEHVLANLVGNAARFAPAGTPIDLEVAATAAGACLAVRDRGPGIPPEERERVFDRLRQGRDAGHAGGMGLGLYISRQIAELHGGRLVAEAAPGGGARFVLSLPTEDVPS